MRNHQLCRLKCRFGILHLPLWRHPDLHPDLCVTIATNLVSIWGLSALAKVTPAGFRRRPGRFVNDKHDNVRNVHSKI